MPRGLLMVDGLSRCLCPCLEQLCLADSRPLFSGRYPVRRNCRGPARAHSTTSAAHEPGGGSSVATSEHSAVINWSPLVPSALPPPGSSNSQPRPTRPFRVPSWRQWENGDYTAEEVDRTRLEGLLRDEFSLKPDLRRTSQLIAILIRALGVKPQLIHYRAMILANRDTGLGSPIQVRNLLEDMKKNNIPVDSATLHAALQVLAIHPDYILRNEILRTLRDRWSPLSRAGWHDVVVGQIRERQYELALDTLSRMEAQHISVDPWLYDLLTYNLIAAEEFGEACDLTRKRVIEGNEISPNLWFKFLDAASEALHEESVNYIWKQRVEPGFLVPSHGMCYNALAITSRSGNTDLANSVFRTLEQRQATLALSDYEALIETYAMAGDISSAFRVLSSMAKRNITFGQDTTRSIFIWFVVTNASPEREWEMVKQMKRQENLDMPVAAANVIIHLCRRLRLFDQAIDIYKEIHTVCMGGPDTVTFNHLFRLISKINAHDKASFLVDEMARMEVPPDSMTYETLIRLCVNAGLYEEGYRYLCEMMANGFELSRIGKIEVRTKCYDSEDYFAKLLQYHEHVRKGIRFYESGGSEAEVEVVEEMETDAENENVQEAEMDNDFREKSVGEYESIKSFRGLMAESEGASVSERSLSSPMGGTMAGRDSERETPTKPSNIAELRRARASSSEISLDALLEESRLIEEGRKRIGRLENQLRKT